MHLLHEVDPAIDARVVRSHAITLDEAEALAPHLRAILISPGPCSPREAGICVPLIQRLAARVPILGVCLGHQCIAEAFGLPVARAAIPVHGKPALIHHTGRGIYRGLPNPFLAARYHSLTVPFAAAEHNPDWQITAWCDERHEPYKVGPDKVGPVSRPVVMGLRRAQPPFSPLSSLLSNPAPLEGLQFHPESFLTARDHGALLIRNFLSSADAFHAAQQISTRPAPHTLLAT